MSEDNKILLLATGKTVLNEQEKEKANKKGFLIKRGEVVKNWKKRWFILLDNPQSLLYYKNEKEKVPAGVIDLKGSKIKEVDVSLYKKEFCFSLLPEVSYTKNKKQTNRWYFVQAKSNEERDEWMKALQELIENKPQQKKEENNNNNNEKQVNEVLNEIEKIEKTLPNNENNNKEVKVEDKKVENTKDTKDTKNDKPLVIPVIEIKNTPIGNQRPVLYHFPGSRSDRIALLIKEMGIDVEIKLIDMMKGDHKNESFLKINPNGTLPTLVDGDLKLFESFAIVQHLLEKYDSPLFPSDPHLKPIYFQYSYWTASTLDPCITPAFFQLLFVPEEQRNLRLIETLKKTFEDALSPLLENHLNGKEYMLGNFSALDCVLGYILIGANKIGWISEKFPNLKKYIGNLSQRKALAEIFPQQNNNQEVKSRGVEDDVQSKVEQDTLKKIDNNNQQSTSPINYKPLDLESKPVLFHMNKTRSTRVFWLVKEMGIDVEIKVIDMMKGEHKTEEYKRINPNGTLPALYDGTLKLFESFAIVQHLLERYDSPLLPSDPHLKSLYFQYSFWTATVVDPCIITTTLQLILPPNNRNNQLIDDNKNLFHNTIVPMLEKLLGDNEFLLGKFSALDIVLGFPLQIADHNLGWFENYPKLQEYKKNLYKRNSTIESF
eukprot:TRINITY_DN481_c0_g1_i2.p1 TRINITY_DN481_c0_g1~~TRINITY_DN481_c0_g1_i2.p1  ORF type:complete len:660 (-),score=256.17 TRINITY_DN481_c0_g1_i2:22-2001(-)